MLVVRLLTKHGPGLVDDSSTGGEIRIEGESPTTECDGQAGEMGAVFVFFTSFCLLHDKTVLQLEREALQKLAEINRGQNRCGH